MVVLAEAMIVFMIVLFLGIPLTLLYYLTIRKSKSGVFNVLAMIPYLWLFKFIMN